MYVRAAASAAVGARRRRTRRPPPDPVLDLRVRPSRCSAKASDVAVVSCPASRKISTWSRTSASVRRSPSSRASRSRPSRSCCPLGPLAAGDDRVADTCSARCARHDPPVGRSGRPSGSRSAAIARRLTAPLSGAVRCTTGSGLRSRRRTGRGRRPAGSAASSPRAGRPRAAARPARPAVSSATSPMTAAYPATRWR